MGQLFQDGMAIVRKHGKPHLFITMTCNPEWPEIVAEVKATGGQVGDRQDVVARVFRLKFKALEQELYNIGIGRSVAHLRVVEFQKRGLPHAHILLILHVDNCPRSPDDWHKFVQAELTDEKAHPKLFKIVSKNNMHGPCKKRPCGREMVNGKCIKKYSKDFCECDASTMKGFAQYKRRDAAHTADMTTII
jgi:ATP-dependent DNA helicase PIF1